MFSAILTLFPGAIRPYLDESILGIAQAQGKLGIELIDFRAFTTDPHRTVDDRPFGGGPGMVLKPEPIFDAIEDAEARHGAFHKILLCPRGKTFTQQRARELSKMERLLFVCGRYEGYDERIRQGMTFEEISLGDFILAGGELAAMVVLEAAVRLIPGVLGCAQSPELESFESELLDYPQYTRPRSYRGMEVPPVLLSGDHAQVAKWRLEQSRILTARKLSDSSTPDPTGPTDPTGPNNQTGIGSQAARRGSDRNPKA
ncbi:MAG: tRNA (guanosine(37)-N1)-methyltransferase TrmD [Phycisphaerales bacterium]